MFDPDLRAFVVESNRIEGIRREPTEAEFEAHKAFLDLEVVRVEDLAKFVGVVAPGAALRDQPFMNVSVGSHRPPDGGRKVLIALLELLDRLDKNADPYLIHHAYENLHPFMDGNGRSGRVLWLWQMLHNDRQLMDPHVLQRGFLHTFYYQTLEDGQRRGIC